MLIKNDTKEDRWGIQPKLHSMLKANSQHLSLLFMIDLAKSHLQILNRADINVVLEWA
jgi:hypothetical protein